MEVSGNFVLNVSALLFNKQEWQRKKIDLLLVEEAAALVRTNWVQRTCFCVLVGAKTDWHVLRSVGPRSFVLPLRFHLQSLVANEISA